LGRFFFLFPSACAGSIVGVRKRLKNRKLSNF